MGGTHFICYFVSAYLIVVVARIILSFVPVNEGSIISSMATVVYTLTEPVFAPIRKALPTPGDIPIDFSPAVVMIVLFILRTLFC